jgi:hypothetical protein
MYYWLECSNTNGEGDETGEEEYEEAESKEDRVGEPVNEDTVPG